MFPIELAHKVELYPNDLSDFFKPVFETVDKQVSKLKSGYVGSTACVAVVRKENNQNILYIANAGDTRAVLSSNGQAQRLSKDHKATDPEEVKIVEANGGIIKDGRVGGCLAVTRAIGDHALRKFGATCDPYTLRHVLRPQDKYLVIASDGIWDMVSDD
jgi:serine/threonine protein phosphatase PrpC